MSTNAREQAASLLGIEVQETPRKERRPTRGRPFEKGNPGRKKGSLNKSTRTINDLIDALIEWAGEDDPVKGYPRAIYWLQQTGARSPEKAIQILASLAEFRAPKLARTEVRAEVDQKVSYSISFKR